MTATVQYIATIRLEAGRYIAYDQDNNRRTYGDASNASATSSRKLAEYLFQETEIGNVTVLNGVTCVEVLG